MTCKFAGCHQLPYIVTSRHELAFLIERGTHNSQFISEIRDANLLLHDGPVIEAHWSTMGCFAFRLCRKFILVASFVHNVNGPLEGLSGLAPFRSFAMAQTFACCLCAQIIDLPLIRRVDPVSRDNVAESIAFSRFEIGDVLCRGIRRGSSANAGIETVGEVVTPFVQVGTYPTRNFATLGWL